ncbi:MAG: isoprenylcysteine carboxylmethyltransferase family protein [bacterium]
MYAEGLVCEGVFAHCRNPLYIGNMLMLLGFGLAFNSLLCLAVGGPCFLFIYSAIVRAEENFLRGKFAAAFDDYCRAVSRWRVRLSGLGATIRSMQFHWRRLLVKEYGTCFNWMAGLPIAFYIKHHLMEPHEKTGRTKNREARRTKPSARCRS